MSDDNGAASASSAGAVTLTADDGFISLADETAAAADDEVDAAPWMTEAQQILSLAGDEVNPLVALHNEILSFCDLVQPTAREVAQRARAVSELTDAVRAVWPGARLEVFGSQLTGLWLPSSDVDAVVFGAVGARPLRQLAAELRRRDLVSFLELVESARVPIIKLVHAATGVPMDVSFDIDSGLRTGRLINELLRAMPPLRPLILVLKHFLLQRRLNETFTGGIGSFMLQLMVVSFLQMRHRTDCATGVRCAPNLGSLLLEFFELYGRDFNYGVTGISVRHAGSYFQKRSRGWLYPQRPALLAIENPSDPSFDVGKNSYQVSTAKRAFQHAHASLLVAATQRGAAGAAGAAAARSSLLARVIRTDALLAERALPPEPVFRTDAYESDDDDDDDAARNHKRRRRSG